MASGYINIPAYGSPSWKDPVPSAVNLPSNGNQPGDARVALDTDTIYIWSGSMWVAAASGGPGVTSLNSLTGALALVAGSGITVTPSGSTITIASTGGGTVSSVSVVPANGFTGTVANPTTTPAITLTGTLTGDVTGTISANHLTATTNSTLTTLSALSLPYSQVTGTPAALVFADSLVNTSGTVTLVGDAASPAASSYYGTNASSVLGYYSLSAANGFTYLSSNSSVYGGTHSTLSFTGSDNLVVGVTAASALTSGVGNVIMGSRAGHALTTGSSNVLLGAFSAADATTLDNAVIIGSNAATVGVLTSADDGFVAIGYEAGFQTHPGGGAGATYVGYQAGAGATTGIQNTYVGYQAGFNQTGTTQNTCVGWVAGTNTGANNGVAVGWKAAFGSLTTSIGYNSGSGDPVSVFIGSFSSGTGNYNAETVCGYGSLVNGGQNAILGASAQAGSAGAGGCIAIGFNSLSGRTGSGGAAIAIGQTSSVTGIGSVCIGANASDGGNNYSLSLGQAKPNNTNCLVFGLTTDQSVAIATTASNQVTFGTSGSHAIQLSDLYLGRGAVGDATAPNCSVQPSPTVGANIAGGNLTITSGNGTGTGGSGSIIFKTAPVAASSSTANTMTTVGSISNTGAHTLGAASTTPVHVINGLTTSGGATTATFTNVPTGATTPTGYLQVMINGVTSYIPYFQ